MSFDRLRCTMFLSVTRSLQDRIPALWKPKNEDCLVCDTCWHMLTPLRLIKVRPRHHTVRTTSTLILKAHEGSKASYRVWYVLTHAAIGTAIDKMSDRMDYRDIESSRRKANEKNINMAWKPNANCRMWQKLLTAHTIVTAIDKMSDRIRTTEILKPQEG